MQRTDQHQTHLHGLRRSQSCSRASSRDSVAAKCACTVSQLASGNRAGRDCFRSARTSALAWGHCVVSRHAPLLSRMWIRFVRLFIHFLLLWVPVVRGFGLPTFAMLCGRPRRIFSCASSLRWSTSSYKAKFLSLFAHLYVARP